jgi:hypothetical protein
MRKPAIIAAVLVVAAAAVASQVATSRAGWHVLSETAINTKKLCRDGLTYTWATDQQDTKPPASRPVGAPGWRGPVDLLIQSGPSSLPPDPSSWEDQPMAGADVFTAGYAPVKNPGPPVSWYPYSHSGTVPFRHPLTPSSDAVRVDTEPNGVDTTEVFLPVTACYLWGPIDITPGDPANTVDMSAGASVTVALLSTGTFNATHVTASTVRFGATGTETAPTASTNADVNGDGRNDLRLTFTSGQTGLDCTSSTEASLSATDPATQKTFYESAPVHPINC